MLTFETVVSNVGKSYRKSRLYGRDHLVVPVTMIVPGVLNGSRGPISYTKEENDKSVSRWNGMPITEGHPKIHGQSVSARSEEVLNKFQHGILLNTKSEDNLTAEAWIDIENSQRVNPKVVWSILNNKKIEVSTGLEMVVVQNGEELIATEYAPDHLAILTDTIGACSIKDGCGLGVENELDSIELESVLHHQLRKRFSIANGANESLELMSINVTDDYIVYNHDDQMYRLGYEVEASDVKLAENPVKVDRRVSYVSVSNKRGDEMKKGQLIDSIVNSSCDCWGEEDREVLNGFEVDKLTRINDGIIANEAAKKTVEALNNFDSDDFELTVNEGQVVVNSKSTSPEFDEAKLVKTITESVENSFMQKYGADITFSQEYRKEQREKVINSLCDGDDDPRRSIFEDMSDEALKVMAENAGSSEPVTPAVPQFFGGKTGPVSNTKVSNAYDSNDVLGPAPSLSWD